MSLPHPEICLSLTSLSLGAEPIASKKGFLQIGPHAIMAPQGVVKAVDGGARGERDREREEGGGGAQPSCRG